LPLIPLLKISGVKQLIPQGLDLNHLDWSWVLKVHFRAAGVAYIIEPDEAKAKAIAAT